jgi:hypothetical protein
MLIHTVSRLLITLDHDHTKARGSTEILNFQIGQVGNLSDDVGFSLLLSASKVFKVGLVLANTVQP